MKIAVLLSGGVDSSVALNLIKRAGYKDITAFYLKIWFEDELSYLGECPWEADLKDARIICERADVPLEIVPLQRAYFDRVVEHAIRELKAGRTPSPDILCNQQIKFGEFLNCIDESYDKVASGHYARIKKSNGDYLLRRAPDPVKDQTYFLCYLGQEQLSRAMFPVGEYYKDEVRLLAAYFDLPNQHRRDSQGICFLGQIKYPEFVKAYLGEEKGDIVDIESQRKVGEHNGYWFFTIGQRRGLGISHGPWFVVDKDVENNIIYVSHKKRIASQARKEFVVNNINWIPKEPDSSELLLKIRHSPHIEPCHIKRLSDNRVVVCIEEAKRDIAAGQFAVFYDENYCLGGGVIA